MLRAKIHSLLRLSGFDLVHFDGRKFAERRRAELMKTLGIDLVLDVGANTGQYIEEIRENGFQGNVIAFEPLASASEQLVEAARSDPRLTVYQCAIGADESQAVIHVAANSYSSSLLEMEEVHLRAAPGSNYIDSEEVRVRPLDSFEIPDATLWIKIDAQGHERDVLEGARRTLQRAHAVEIELSYVSLYRGQALACEVQEALGGHGFRLAALGRPFYDSTETSLLQIDAIFLHANRLPPQAAIERA
jgi:FkbM family methyltransferase